MDDRITTERLVQLCVRAYKNVMQDGPKEETLSILAQAWEDSDVRKRNQDDVARETARDNEEVS
jgi:hypothetical protein